MPGNQHGAAFLPHLSDYYQCNPKSSLYQPTSASILIKERNDEILAPVEAVGQIRLFHMLFNENPQLTICVVILLLAIIWHLNYKRRQ